MAEMAGEETIFRQRSRLDRSYSCEAVVRWHEQGRKQLSVGLELECFLPDIGACVPDRLVPVVHKKELFGLVADELTRRLSRVNTHAAGLSEKGDNGHEPAHRCRADWRRAVSADECDWGRLWTATSDGSIQPQGANPFPVEIVSKRMHFEEFDVSLFCDVVHALRSPPLCAATNESTGLHVHLGKYPHFFSLVEVAAILKAYLRLEPVINSELLPVTRRQNKFCKDLREVLARGAGLGETATDELLFEHIDRLVSWIQRLSSQDRDVLCTGVWGSLSKGSLMSALLGEGTLWRAKTALELSPSLAVPTQKLSPDAQCRLPPGMVLQEIRSRAKRDAGALLWKIPTSEDLVAMWGEDGGGDSGAELPTPWDALEPLDDADEVDCLFRIPEDVPKESVDLWLLRDGLILDRHGARYCKLNIMRIALPSEKATLEFRQFPGGDFGQTLLIWGWVKFLGLLVTHACAAGNGVSGADLPQGGTEQALGRFLQLATDTMLVAWYRDVHNRLPVRPDAPLESARTEWMRLWAAWNDICDGGSMPGRCHFLTACELWRRIFQAAKGMQPLFAQDDPIWQPMRANRDSAKKFMHRLFTALGEWLSAYVARLRAVEEVSRLTSLQTVVRLVVDDGQLHGECDEIRTLQATIAETQGWSGCSPELMLKVQTSSQEAADLTLDHARNILSHCERGAKQLLHDGESAADEDAAGIRNGEPDAGMAGPGFVASKKLKEFPLAATGSAMPDAAGKATAGESTAVLVALDRAYRELCTWLLVPRVQEVEGLWAGLRQRGWDALRVEALNKQMAEVRSRYAGAISVTTSSNAGTHKRGRHSFTPRALAGGDRAVTIVD